MTGVDISEDSIRHAQRKYACQNNLRFLTGTCQEIPCPDDSFDVVVSFETIEHIEDQEQFLREVKRVLKKDGVLVMSSPNIAVYNSSAKEKNPFHKHELGVAELQSLLRRHFSHIRLYGQRLTLGSHIWPMEDRPEVTWKVFSKEGTTAAHSIPPEYFIALCSRGSLEDIPGASVFRDESNDLTHDYHARGVWAQSLDNELRQAKAELAKLKNGGNGNPPVRSDRRQLAKAHIRDHRWKPAVDILQSLIAQDPNDIAAVLDLALICVHRRELEACSTLVNHVLALDPGNRGAMDILRQLSIRETSRRNTELSFEISRCRSRDEYELHRGSLRDSPFSDVNLKGELQKVGDGFGIAGHCYVCDDDVVFRVESAHHDEHGIPDAVNWRETLVCPQCGLTNRTRAAMHLFETLVHPTDQLSIYVAEQTTPFYREIVNRYKNVIGSEFFGPHVQPGTIDRNGIRHEDFTRLSFQGASLDCVMSFDVFEHVPDYERAFRECSRVLKPGGSLFFSVPFERTVPQTQIRAVSHSDGSIEHILPPEYHGDPIHPGGGCLCYQIFGWDVLDLLKRSGFDTCEAILYQSAEFGYLGGEQIAFLASKRMVDHVSVPKATPAISMRPIPVWETDRQFNLAMSKIPFTLVDKQRCFMLYQFALQSLRCEGHVAEVGVYRGGTAKLFALLLEGSGKDLHLFDTFEGMPETDTEKDLHHKGDFSDTSLEGVKEIVGQDPHIHYYPGFFPATSGPIEAFKFCFVHIDVDIYRSVLDSCEFFYPRMATGGIMVFDDYGFESCPGAKRAVDEFFAARQERPWYLPTGQCVVVKL